MFIGLYCCLLVRVQPLSLAWADLHHTNSLWALFQRPIIEFRLDYPIFYLGTSKFSPQHIITRFGVLESLVSDNRLQFDSKAFHKFCSDLGIKNRYSTPVYLQSNGQAEATNKAIVNGLKKRLDSAKGRWAEEQSLSQVL